MAAKSIERTTEFLEGYGACGRFISRTHNPFDKNTTQWFEWHEGWNTRFYGESIYEGEPDP